MSAGITASSAPVLLPVIHCLCDSGLVLPLRPATQLDPQAPLEAWNSELPVLFLEEGAL